MKSKSMFCRYMVRMTVGMVAYGVGLIAMCFYAGKGPNKFCWAILPVLAIVYLVAIIIRYVSEMDEMWRKIITEAAAFSGLAVGFTCFSYMFLLDLGAPVFHAEWAFYLMWVYYGIGLLLSWRRYQ